MPGVSISQVVIVIVFLALLVGVQVWVRRNREGIGARLRQGREIVVVEQANLAPTERVTLLRVGDRRVLVYSARGTAGALLDLGRDDAPTGGTQ